MTNREQLEHAIIAAAESRDADTFLELAAKLPGRLREAQGVVRNGVVFASVDRQSPLPIRISSAASKPAASKSPRTRTIPRPATKPTRRLSLDITPTAYRELLDHALTWDGRERAGGLFGYTDGDTIVIDDVGGPGEPGTSTTCKVNTRTCREIERQLAVCGIDSRWLGDWHLEPGQADPSPQDVAGWRALAKKLGRRYVGFVVSPGRDPEFLFDRPRLRAWVVEDESITPLGEFRA